LKGAIPAKGPAERALDRILDTDDAKLVAQLSNGPTNSSYHVEQGGGHYVLRLDKPDAASLGLDRRNEDLACRAAAAADLAPEPIYFDPAEGICLRRFLPGRSWVNSDLESTHNLERLARLLQKLHSTAPAGKVFDPLAAARRYAGQLDNQASYAVLGRAEELMQEIAGHSPGQALCHNDLVCQNIFEGERLILIDWEYAGIGDPFFDLAVVVQHHSLSSALTDAFLGAYLARTASRRERNQLDLQCRFYACLLQLWNTRTAKPQP